MSAHFHRDATPHTDWCVRDHTCGLAEHRGRPIIVAPEAGGRAIVTRVHAGDREYAAITLRVPLHRSASVAAAQLGEVLSGIRNLLAAVAALRPGALGSRPDQRALGRRSA
ncbi:hypothetical protein [Actinoplanes sp. HUAS TT8]|uniref:hypothetical protein n=1 Tax=Actinoplanes sp. HUAS TT8 TaxID=3447453 RepID=UPI003F527C68